MGKILMYNNVIHVDYMMSGGFFLEGGGGVGLEYLHQTLIYKIIDIHLSVAQQN